MRRVLGSIFVLTLLVAAGYSQTFRGAINGTVSDPTGAMVSSANARGVMQIMPGTALWLETGVFGYELYEESSAYDNIKMGVKYLQILIAETHGDERLAVASYYQGLSPTQAGVFYPDTQDYVDMIFRVRDTYWPG